MTDEGPIGELESPWMSSEQKEVINMEKYERKRYGSKWDKTEVGGKDRSFIV